MDDAARRRSVVSALLVLSLLLLPAPAHGQPARTVDQILTSMTLPQKVGQLFATYVYGGDATVPAAADIAATQRSYGVGTPAQVIAKYHLGGAIYFSWSHNLGTPRQIATLSNGLQAAA